jgi:hypothetical protein
VSLLLVTVSACASNVAFIDPDLSAATSRALTPVPSVPDYRGLWQSGQFQLEQAQTSTEIRRAISSLAAAKEKAPVDFWPINLDLAYAYYRIGQRELALGAMLNAAPHAQSIDLWANAALLAAENGDHALANAIVAEKLKDPGSIPDDGKETILWLQKLYAVQNLETLPGLPEVEGSFYCKADSSSEDDDTDGGDEGDGDGAWDFDFNDSKDQHDEAYASRESSHASFDPCDDKQILIDAFFIAQQSTKDAIVGVDLVSELEAQFGATLIDSSSQTIDGDLTKILSRSRYLKLKDVSIALSLASNSKSVGAIQSSLSISGTLGKPAKLFAGGEVVIIGTGDFGANQYEGDVGLTITITPTLITPDKVVMDVTAENSAIVSNSAFPSFQVLTTRKLNTETAASVGYAAPAIISNFSSEEVLTQGAGQAGLQHIPAIDLLTSQQSSILVKRENVLMLVVRPGWDRGGGAQNLRAQQVAAKRLGFGTLRNVRPRMLVLPYPRLTWPTTGELVH